MGIRPRMRIVKVIRGYPELSSAFCGKPWLTQITAVQYNPSEANMSKQKLRVLVFLALVASFCVIPSVPSRALDVRTNHMPGADFGKYKSYRWGGIEDSA